MSTQRRRLHGVRSTSARFDSACAPPEGTNAHGAGAHGTHPHGTHADDTRADDTHPSGTGPPEDSRETALVGYLVLVPEGTDPAALFTASGTVGTRPGIPEIHPAPAGVAVSPPPSPRSAGPGLHIDIDRHTAEVDGRRLDLTYLEFQLLAHLATNPYRVHSRAHLTTAIWGYAHVGDGRTVDVHIARLRRKLGAPYRRRIVTVRRVGYKYLPERSDPGTPPELR